MPLISKDLSGEIAQEDPELYEELQEAGYRIYAEFNTEELQRLFEILIAEEEYEEAEKVLEHMEYSIQYWRDRIKQDLGIDADYDPSAKRWRDVKTGRWIKDPYTYLWSESE